MANSQRGNALARTQALCEQSAIMETRQPISLGKALLLGTAGFTVASLIVYGFWAGAGRFMYRTVGEAGFYAVCAVLFVALGAVLLKPLAPLSFGRFAAVFAGAFF